MRQLIAGAVAVAIAVSGCSLGQPGPSPTPTSSTQAPASMPSADEALAQVAAAMTTGDFAASPLSQDPQDSAADRATIIEGMGDLAPDVSPGVVTYDEGSGTASGELNWQWPTEPQPWRYTSTVTLRLVGGETWQWDWDPTVVHPNATEASRLLAREVPATRGRILGGDGTALMDNREVTSVGLDKSQVPSNDWIDSATQIAELVQIDVDDYVAKVKAYGPVAFVPALTARGSEVPAGLSAIDGGYAKTTRQMLPPYDGFAESLLGTVAEVTAEDIEKSGGTLRSGDVVGRSGLEAQYDEQLRGSAGLKVLLVARDPDAPSDDILPAVIATIEAEESSDLQTTLDYAWQKKVEGVLAAEGKKRDLAVAVVQPSTGKVLALAESPHAKLAPMANAGHYAPGSTFKVVSALALLRDGLKPSSKVRCNETATVNGRLVRNFPGYPRQWLGSISLQDALVHSCNTAFVNATQTISDDGLVDAAGALGLGTDYVAGFPSFFGSVPRPTNSVEKAEASFGQGVVEMSPMAVAGMSASVASGRTVVPWLVTELKPTTGPLTAAEAQQLRAMMEATAASPGYTKHNGTLQGAKTGTAEYVDPKGKTRKHIWLTGYTGDDIAITVFGRTGEWGSDLLPVVAKVLS